jgi:chorismate mutase
VPIGARTAALALVLSFASGAAAPPSDAIARLKDAIAARLLLADDVARYKWNRDQPVEDPEREVAVLERTTAQAVALGIPEAYARRVVAAQIAASRARQQVLINRWRAAKHTPFADVPDLAVVQRPAIDRATAVLLARLHAAMCSLDDVARVTLSSPPLSFDGSARPWATAVDPLWPPPAECRD